MNRSARGLFLSLCFLVPLLAASDDQQKAHKILNKVTAMAIDPAGKRAVSLSISQCLSVGRGELAQRRHAMNMNYGDIFIAYELVKSAGKIDDIAAKIKAGKTVWQAADEMNADWKQIANEAKKVNGKVDTNLLEHFTKRKAEHERDLAEGYDPFLDTVAADSKVSQPDVEEAQKRYVFLRDHAGVVSDATLDTSTEKSARIVRPDPVRTETRVGAGSTSTPKN
jgi:hypothetical protein